VLTRNDKRHSNGTHVLEAIPQTIAHGAEEGATKLAEAVELASARVARGAGQVAKGAGQASGRASELSGQLSGQIKEKVGTVPLDLKDAKLTAREAKLNMKQARLGLTQRLTGAMMGGSMARRRRSRLLTPSTDAMLKAQLVKTSRELAHESSDLGAAVESLNRVIKANRRAAAKGRTRLLGGMALGAAAMYHFDAEHGRERRAATMRMLTSAISGQRRPPSAVA
jgi:hypothetical protein